MCERIKTISRHYNDLKYERNKDEALKRISTLRSELKFKDVNDYSNRFLQTASVIEKNVSVFKSACDHVDIVTTLIEHLYNVGTTLMFAKNVYVYDRLYIIYMMSIICQEDEIPSFLETAIVNNSDLATTDEWYKEFLSGYTMEMIVFEDSDLYAVISYLKINPLSLLKIKKIFVQESVKQKFLWLIEKNFECFLHINLPISIFHSWDEIIFASSSNLNMMSMWTEDITFAKALAILLSKDIIFINSHLEFGSGIEFPGKEPQSAFELSNHNLVELKDTDKINPSACIGSIYNFFYDGKWQHPVKNTYWTYNGNTYAHATQNDLDNCVYSAMAAWKTWNKSSISSRVEILDKLASTLECNGKFLLAKTVLKWTKISKVFESTLTCQDERLEVITIRAPRGVIFLHYNDEVTLFSYLTLSLMLGNSVIVLCNKNSYNLTRYCNMFSTSEIPPGVVNMLLNRDMYKYSFTENSNYTLEDLFLLFTVPQNIILPLK